MQFALLRSALLSLPTPPYDPAAQHTYYKLVPGSRTTCGSAAVSPTASPAANTTNATNTADRVEVPSPTSSFRQAMGVPHALRFPQFQKVCVYVGAFAFVEFLGHFV